MAVSMAAIMRQTRNYFARFFIEGDFTLADGVLTPMPDAPFLAIRGSARCDGVYPAAALPRVSERFSGTVYALFPPADFLELCEEIAAYDAQNPAGSPLSEALGVYRYARASGGWEAAFAARLAPYRRMFSEVYV